MNVEKNYFESVVNKKSCLIGAMLMIGCTQPAVAATIANYYQVIDLGTFGGQSSRATSINEKGQIVGTATDGAGRIKVFLYENGVMKDIGVSGGGDVFINNKGQIAGDVYEINQNGSYSPANNFIYENGKISLLNIQYAYIKGLNNNGDIIGEASNPNLPFYGNAFLFRNGVLTDLGALIGDGQAGVGGMNDKGQIVWWYSTSTGEDPSGAYLYDNSIVSKLNFIDSRYGGAADINNGGDIIGRIQYENGTDTAFLYDGNLMKFSYGDIAFKHEASALDVNNLGVAVGNTGGPFEPAAILFMDGQMIDLNKRVVGDNPFTLLLSAEAINDQGQIVGFGYSDFGGIRAFLMNPVPVPEPGAAGLIICLGMGFAFRRVRAGNCRRAAGF